MTDDALHLNWVFEKSFMWEALCFEVIANNELAFSHLWSQGKKKRKKKTLQKSFMLVMDTGLLDTFKCSLLAPCGNLS